MTSVMTVTSIKTETQLESAKSEEVLMLGFSRGVAPKYIYLFTPIDGKHSIFMVIYIRLEKGGENCMQKIESDINPPSERIFIQTWQKLPRHFYLSRVTRELQPGEPVPEGWHLVIDRSELNPLGQTPITIEDDPNEPIVPPDNDWFD